jgi:hypothetical protein
VLFDLQLVLFRVGVQQAARLLAVLHLPPGLEEPVERLLAQQLLGQPQRALLEELGLRVLFEEHEGEAALALAEVAEEEVVADALAVEGPASHVGEDFLELGQLAEVALEAALLLLQVDEQLAERRLRSATSPG